MNADLTSPFLDDILPKVEPYKSLTLDIRDVFIHSPGFEDRTLAFTKGVTFSEGARAILLDYLPFKPENKLTGVREALLSRGVEVSNEDILEYNRFEPGNFEDRLNKKLQSIRANRVCYRYFNHVQTRNYACPKHLP